MRQNLVARSPLLGRSVFIALAAAMVTVSAVHALLVPLALARNYSDAHGGTAQELLEPLRNYYGLTYNLAKGPGYVLLLGLVVLGRSSYPWWTALTVKLERTTSRVDTTTVYCQKTRPNSPRQGVCDPLHHRNPVRPFCLHNGRHRPGAVTGTLACGVMPSIPVGFQFPPEEGEKCLGGGIGRIF